MLNEMYQPTYEWKVVAKTLHNFKDQDIDSFCR